MTKDDWEWVKKQLQSSYRPVILNCDGYIVRLNLGMVSQFKNGIHIFINGEFRAKWMMEECEERRRFLPVRFRNAYGCKYKKIYKGMRKSTLKRLKIDLDKKLPVYGFCWTSFESMKRHFCKNNANIELIREAES